MSKSCTKCNANDPQNRKRTAVQCEKCKWQTVDSNSWWKSTCELDRLQTAGSRQQTAYCRQREHNVTNLTAHPQMWLRLSLKAASADWVPFPTVEIPYAYHNKHNYKHMYIHMYIYYKYKCVYVCIYMYSLSNLARSSIIIPLRLKSNIHM